MKTDYEVLFMLQFSDSFSLGVFFISFLSLHIKNSISHNALLLKRQSTIALFCFWEKTNLCECFRVVFLSVLSTCSPKVYREYWSLFDDVTRVFIFSVCCHRLRRGRSLFWTLLGQTLSPSCLNMNAKRQKNKKSLEKVEKRKE